MIYQSLRDQCLFESLQGGKSHWFTIMDTVLNGCVKQDDPAATTPMKVILPSCYKSAMKFSSAYLKFDHEKYDKCVDTQIREIEEHENRDHFDSKSKSFLDRDIQRERDVPITYHPMFTVNGIPFEGSLKNANELFKTICSKLEDRPEECKSDSLFSKKEQMIKEYND